MPTPLVFSCQHCGSILSAPAHPAGTRGPCPICGITVSAPVSPPAPANPTTSPDDDEDEVDFLSPPPIEPPSAEPEPTEAPSEQLDPWVPLTQPPAFPSQVAMTVPKPPSSKSPSLARWVSLFILLGGLGTAIWLSRDNSFPQRSSKPNTGMSGGTYHPEPAGQNNGNLPAIPTPVATSSPTTGLTTPTPIIAPLLPSAPTPTTSDPAQTSAPPPPAVTPVLPTPEAAPARGFRDAADAFLRATTPEARLPLLFSSRWSPEQLAEQLVSGRLSRLPAMEYKTVVHFSNSGAGVQHYHVAVKTTDSDGPSPGRELLLHLTNHGGAGFRVNADALAFHLENPIPGFVGNPTDEPLPAWVFIERGHFQGEGDTENRLCLSLRMSPLTPVVAQALVESDSPILPALTPWVGWGSPPKPVLLELRHSKLGQLPVLTLGNTLAADWLPPPAP